jgi:uncharacterized protein DUF2478
MTFDAQCDLAALVYEPHQDPDDLLRGFARELNAQGFRAVGLVQLGHHRVDPDLSAMLLHTGEQLPLTQDLGRCATGCRLDVGRLLEAGTRIAGAIETGADLVIITASGGRSAKAEACPS